jgi:hypothetical protein
MTALMGDNLVNLAQSMADYTESGWRAICA